METLSTLLWICGLLVVFLMAILRGLLLRRLRLRHRDTWSALGEPSLFWNDAPRHSRAFAEFARDGGVTRLGDPIVPRLLSTSRILARVAWVLFK